MVGCAIVLARRRDIELVFGSACGKERLGSRLWWWIFGSSEGAATIWWRKREQHWVDDGGRMVAEGEGVATLAVDAEREDDHVS
jgi:hypothetical protein